MILSGVDGDRIGNDEYYLYFGQSSDKDWTMTPNYFSLYDSFGFAMGSLGISDRFTNGLDYIRPVISLKVGTIYEKGGDGTPTAPYVVKYN